MTDFDPTATDLDETCLIERTQNGETEAFSALVQTYHARLYRHIQRRVSDVETAKDLTQEVWLKAFRGIQGFRCESSFYAWLYRIAENVIKDFFRRLRHAPDIAPLHSISEHRIRETAACPSRDVLRGELRLQLREAICQLTPLRRRVFLLYYHKELPIKAIAQKMGRSEGTIKTHLRNARKQLQERLSACRC